MKAHISSASGIGFGSGRVSFVRSVMLLKPRVAVFFGSSFFKDRIIGYVTAPSNTCSSPNSTISKF